MHPAMVALTNRTTDSLDPNANKGSTSDSSEVKCLAVRDVDACAEGSLEFITRRAKLSTRIVDGWNAA